MSSKDDEKFVKRIQHWVVVCAKINMHPADCYKMFHELAADSYTLYLQLKTVL